MKDLLWALVALSIGSVIGIAWAVHELGISPEVNLPRPAASGQSSAARPPAASAAGEPRIQVEPEVHDFGTMDSKSEKSHDFVIRNVGTAVLVIENKGTTCKCAVSDFQSRTIKPGKSTKITLTWTAKEFFGPFEQQATIGTNDPQRPKVVLKVKGRITAPLRASPMEVVFADVAAGQPAHTSVNVYAYKTADLKLKDLRLEDPTTAELFEITPKRLTPERIREEKDAQSGYELDIRLKPGLPLGPFRQTILLETNSPKDPKLEVPIKGKIGSDITIAGRDWNERRQTLELGVLAHGQGAERTLFLRVRGYYRRAIEFEVAETFPPEVLSAELGKEGTFSQGIAVRVPLVIRVGKDTGAANYLGSKQSPPGHVILNTNHPQVPKIKILVSFAVEGG